MKFGTRKATDERQICPEHFAFWAIWSAGTCHSFHFQRLVVGLKLTRDLARRPF